MDELERLLAPKSYKLKVIIAIVLFTSLFVVLNMWHIPQLVTAISSFVLGVILAVLWTI